MNRSDFLKGLGIAGIGAALPLGKAKAAIDAVNKATVSCVLAPSETAGPYPWDLSGNAAMFRQDITEGNSGLPLNLTITLVNVNNNCNPVANARVDIWHCNKDGYYSEYNNQPGYLGTQNHVGETFFRGIQVSDASGQVTFKTIYPGWYTGRVTHIHAQIYISSLLSATTQFAFPDSLNNTVYTTSPYYTAHGANTSVANNAADNVFSDTANTAYEMLAVTPNSTTGGYDATITIGISVPATGVINLAPETGGQFTMGQNFPNPYEIETAVPFTLNSESDVMLSLYNITGQKVMDLMQYGLAAGEHTIVVNTNELGIPPGNYIYQLEVSNGNGSFRQCKMMTNR